eukprot:12429156-Karenia_brevis.AAC.1
MAAAILYTCGQCDKPGFCQSQLRVTTLRGREIYQCLSCYTKSDNDGRTPTATQWKKITGESKGLAFILQLTWSMIGAMGVRASVATCVSSIFSTLTSSSPSNLK